MSVTARRSGDFREKRATKRQKTNHSHEVTIAQDEAQSRNGHASVDSSRETRNDNKDSTHTKDSVRIRKPLNTASVVVQVPDLIQELRIDHDAKLRKARSFIDSITDTIHTIPTQTSLSFVQAQAHARKVLGVTVPWGRMPTSDIKYRFAYSKPTTIGIHGSLPQRLSISGWSEVVIDVEMPEELFQEKDYLNCRALHKRAFYLSCIASALQNKSDQGLDVCFDLLHGNEYVPIIRCVPKQATGLRQRTALVVNVTLPQSVGTIDKTTPSHNCLRKDTDQEGRTPTPAYNSTVRRLAAASHCHSLIVHASELCEGYRDSCALAALWLKNRGLDSRKSQGGFGQSEWAILCALLLQSGGPQDRPLFSMRYSALQLFKAMLQVLSTRDLRDPLILRGADLGLGRLHVPIVYDVRTGINVMDKMTPWSYDLLRHYATSSSAVINSPDADAVEHVLRADVRCLALEWDEVYALRIPERDQERLFEVLQQGLGDRISLLHVYTDSEPPWPVHSARPSTATKRLVLGVQVDDQNATNLVVHGPPLEDKQATQNFRTFWGNISELRKFKDGRIEESIVWKPDVSVTAQIVKYLCKIHFSIEQTGITEQQSPSVSRQSKSSSTRARDVFALIHTQFQTLANTLHHLDGLPLPIRSVQPASEILRSATPTEPLASSISQPVDILVEFDSSGRWPDHLGAIQYTKIAFLRKIGDLLEEQDSILETRIGLENTSKASFGCFNSSYLDVVCPSHLRELAPITFRIRVYHDRELHLIQSLLNSSSLRGPALEVHQMALLSLKRTLAATTHTMAIRNLITRFPPLSDTIHNLKSWVGAHYLANHIPAETLELVAAQAFLRPQPWSVRPHNASTAFLRSLYLLSRWDWISSALVVNLNLSEDITPSARADLQTRFEAWRSLDPALNQVTWFIGSSIDNTGVVWTQSNGPEKVVASRVTSLARAAIEHIEKQAKSPVLEDDWNALFAANLSDFDFVLHLSPKVVSRSTGSRHGPNKFKNLVIQEGLKVDTTGIDILQCLCDDLDSAFGSVAVFFSDTKYSGAIRIGGLWRPHVRGEKEFKIRLGMSSIPGKDTAVEDGSDKKSICSFNAAAVLAEMAMLGDGIIDRVTSK